jgi:hypothetical protein
MAFGISFVDIELLIRLAQNQTAETEPISLPADAARLPPAIIPVLSETPSISDSFSTKNSETNIFAAVAENIPPVSLAINSDAEKASKNQAEENNKVADIVFSLTSETKASGIRQSPPASLPASDKQSQTDAEILFRNLLEKFRTSVVYDYETSDAFQLEEDAARRHKPLENFSRATDSSRNRTDRKKEIQDKENLRRESLRNENQSADDKKSELLKKIQAANKFL